MKYYFSLGFIIIGFLACSKQKIPDRNSRGNLDYVKKQIELMSTVTDSSLKDKLLIQTKNHLKNNIIDDSLRNEALFLLSLTFLQKNDSLNFITFNNETLHMSLKLKDTLKIAESFWDLAQFYSQNAQIEEAFFNFSKAQKLYELKEPYLSGIMLLSMAIIQKNIKDYTGSEINTIKAIEIFKSLNKFQSLYSCYNNLGIIHNELQEYPKALEYHRLAQDLASDLNSKDNLEEASLNNIGVVYQNMGAHNEALKYFTSALEKEDLIKSDSELFAMLTDNLAYSDFKLQKTNGDLELFYRALKIREDIGHKSGIVISKIRLSEYFLAKEDTAQATRLLNEASIMARATDNFRDFLKTLLLLSSIDNTVGEEALNEYIRINDSLQKEERLIRNKFARIRYETDEFIAQNEQLQVQRKWMFAGFTGVTLLLILIAVIVFLKRKNKELKLIQLQQKANEEIYNLMIESQSNIELGQEQEKKRISKELHDGILSQFFGVRLNLELLNDRTDQDSVLKREKFIKELKALETEIRKVSHQLNSDLVSSDVSFINILRDLLMDQEDLGGYNGQFDFEGNIEWEKISPKVKINLFRIIQEALHNINKYAGASEVKIIFRNAGEELKVLIEDDGKGFEVENVTNGIGLSNMKSRIQDLGGQLSIFSNHTGTRISLKIPIKNELYESKNTFS